MPLPALPSITCSWDSPLPFSDIALAHARKLVECATAEGLIVTTAESCTGGLLAACLTEIPGASTILERGFITYANSAKQELLGVDGALLDRVGAVSEEVALAMAEGALRAARADLAVAVTGIAGPAGGTDRKPVGLVHMAAARDGRPSLHQRAVFPGDRRHVRMAAVESALALLLRHVDTANPSSRRDALNRIPE